ncbi:MAG: transglycosylase SLT domain-containing protein [Deltaproteobacteria bacterium]|nr:transglycosylase SLT domain-containing protein [Deltaproteobacteria bacterium]
MRSTGLAVAALLALAATPAAADEPACETVALQPWTATSPAFAAAMSAARAGRYEAAAGALEALLDAGPVPGAPPAAGIRYALGRVLESAGRPLDALPWYERASRSEIADEALYRAGLVRLATGDVAGARVAFAGISPASPDWIEARLALADALVREGRAALARVVLRDLFRDDLTPRDTCRARLAVAAAATAAGDLPAARARALAAYLFAADADLATAAARTLAAAGSPVTPARRVLRRLVQAVPGDLAGLRRDRSLARMDKGLPGAARGAWLQVVRKDLAAATRAFAEAADAASAPEVRAFALHSLGSALASSGDDREASARMEAAIAVEPEGPFAAPALVGRARSLMRLSDWDRATAALDRVAAEHPESGLEARARWEIALVALMAGRADVALARLDEAAARLDSGRGVLFGLAEKVRYFRAVALDRLDRRGEAVDEVRRVARGYPHSYYGVLAASRLLEWSGERPARPGVAAGQADDTRRGPFSLPVCADARGAMTLWRLGYGSEGLDALKARARQGLLDEPGLAVLAALVAQASARAPRVAMYAREYLRGLPDDRTAALFGTAYPKPYETAVAEAAGATGADPALVHGVMRAESSFDASARSPAGAIGLMQVMPATGRLVASRILEDPKLGRAIWAPGRNVLLGTAFLAELDRHFRGHLPLVLVAYNAGPGAARKFWKRLKDLPTDVFVEAIPYPVTGAYVKKVIGFAAGYRAVHGDAAVGPDPPGSEAGRGPLLLAPRLPDSLGPFLERRRGVPSS